MRPVERGSTPIERGIEISFTEYAHARPYLIDRLGAYCSYCEMPLASSLAVEHVQPKTHHPEHRLSWTNFLLACASCNSNKGGDDVVLDDYYWPDRHNPMRAIRYGRGGVPRVVAELEPSEAAKAKATLALTGLDRRPGHGLTAQQKQTASDRRWFDRFKAWKEALRARDRLQRRDCPEMREQVVATATKAGFFGVWYSVFEDDSTMLRSLVDSFDAARACFDSRGCLVPRDGCPP